MCTTPVTGIASCQNVQCTDRKENRAHYHLAMFYSHLCFYAYSVFICNNQKRMKLVDNKIRIMTKVEKH